MVLTPRRFWGMLVGAMAVLSSCSSGGSDSTLDTALATTPYELLEGGSSSLGTRVGKPMLVNFFASWCAPCVAEMPDLEALHQEYGDRVVFIGLDTQESVEAGRKIVQKTGVTYEIGRDPDGAMFTAFGGLGMPTTLLIRPDHTIAERHSGALNASRLRSMIDKAFF